MANKDYALLMARYNIWQNQNLIGAASTLDRGSKASRARRLLRLHREDLFTPVVGRRHLAEPL